MEALCDAILRVELRANKAYEYNQFAARVEKWGASSHGKSRLIGYIERQ